MLVRLLVVGNQVLEGEPRTLRLGTEQQVDPADLSAELPGDLQGFRRSAAQDLPPGVAFELIATTGLEVPGDRQEPARDPLRIGQRVPQVVAVRGVHPRRHHDPDVLTFSLSPLNLAKLGPEALRVVHLQPP